MFADFNEVLEFFGMAVTYSIGLCLVVGFISWTVWYLISFFKNAVNA